MFKYQVIKNAVSYDLANFIFNYFLLKRDAVDFMYKNNIIHDTGMFGTWTDQQVPNTYSHYADQVMETLLVKMLPVMAKETGLELIPTYSYARIYKEGNILPKHTDRQSCEISTTLNLGGDPWPIFLKNTKGKKVKINLNPGDMLIYRGPDLEHWRDSFKGSICLQVFLHYNEDKIKNQPYLYDGRKHLGLPK